MVSKLHDLIERAVTLSVDVAHGDHPLGCSIIHKNVEIFHVSRFDLTTVVAIHEVEEWFNSYSFHRVHKLPIAASSIAVSITDSEHILETFNEESSDLVFTWVEVP